MAKYNISSGLIPINTKYFGFKQISVLDGGITGWKNNGYPITTEIPVILRSDYVIKVENTSMVVNANEVQEAIDQKCTIIVDARPHPQYTGEVKGIATNTGKEIIRYGHISKAINLPWPENFIAPNNIFFKDLASLRLLYTERGILGNNKRIITYCNEGVQAVTDWFILAILLCYQNVVVYQSSLIQWAFLPNKPMVTLVPPLLS